MPVAVAAAESGRTGSDEEPPYRFIARKLLEGEVVPFLGAGASVCYHPAHPDGTVICPPTGSALAELLAEEAGFPQDPDLRPDLPLVASYFEHVSVDRSGLCDVLNSVFRPEFVPNALHRLLAQIAARKELLIITTNYDDMIERAFDEAKIPYHLVITAIEDLELGGTVKYRAPGKIWSTRSRASSTSHSPARRSSTKCMAVSIAGSRTLATMSSPRKTISNFSGG